MSTDKISAGWKLFGNVGADPADGAFIGNVDAFDLLFKTNDIERFRIFAAGGALFADDVEADSFSLLDNNAIFFGSTAVTSDFEIVHTPGANNTLDFNVISGASQGTAMQINSADPVQGGRSIDLRGSDTVYLSNFIFMQDNIELRNVENFLTTSIQWKLNNADPDVALRIWQIFSEDPGFESLTLTLGNDGSGVPPLSNHSYAWTGAGVDFDWTPPSISEETNFNSVVNVLPGSITYPTGAAAFEMLKVGGTLNAIDNAAAQTSLISTFSNINHTVQFTNFFSSTNALNTSIIFSPAGTPGGSSDTHSVRGQLGSAFYNGAGLGRTMLACQGAVYQAGAQSTGTVTNAAGIIGSCGIALGAPTVTNATSMQANAPFSFLSTGVITNGVSLQVLGGILGATSNWALQVQNAAVPSYMEGNFMLGSILDTGERLRVTGSSRFEGDFGFSVAPTAAQTGYSFTNDNTVRSINANATSIDELADLVITMARDLIAKGLIAA